MKLLTNPYIDGFVQSLKLEPLTGFPDPKLSLFAFVNNALYIAVQLTEDTYQWVPLINNVSFYVHEQKTTATEWTVKHNLGSTDILIQVFDTNNDQIYCDIKIIDENTCTVIANSPVAGKASVVVKSYTGGTSGEIPEPTDSSYTHIQSQPATTWSISYDLGKLPVFYTVEVNNNGSNVQIEPASVILGTTSATLNFSKAFSGTARFM